MWVNLRSGIEKLGENALINTSAVFPKHFGNTGNKVQSFHKFKTRDINYFSFDMRKKMKLLIMFQSAIFFSILKRVGTPFFWDIFLAIVIA